MPSAGNPASGCSALSFNGCDGTGLTAGRRGCDSSAKNTRLTPAASTKCWFIRTQTERTRLQTSRSTTLSDSWCGEIPGGDCSEGGAYGRDESQGLGDRPTTISNADCGRASYGQQGFMRVESCLSLSTGDVRCKSKELGAIRRGRPYTKPRRFPPHLPPKWGRRFPSSSRFPPPRRACCPVSKPWQHTVATHGDPGVGTETIGDDEGRSAKDVLG